MKVKIIIALLMIALLFVSSASADTDASQDKVNAEISGEVRNQISGIDVTGWDGILNDLPDEVKEFWGGKNASQMVEDYATGQTKFAFSNILDGLWNMLKQELSSHIWLIVKILVLALLTGLLATVSKAFGHEVGETATFICYCLVVAVIITDFAGLVSQTRESIEKINGFMQLVFPILLTLLTAVGGIASAGIFQPAMAMLSSMVSTVVNGVVLPIVLAAGVLAILSNMTDKVQLGQLYSLGKSSAKWIMGLVFTLFFAVMTAQGMSAASFDGISVRTAKYVIDKFVPIVGSMVSGTVDTVLGCTLLIKNAVGVAAIMIAIAVIALPLIKLLGCMFIYRIGAALIEPVADPKLTKLLANIADVTTYLFAAVISVGAMFIISIGLILSAGNANVMIR